MRFEAKLYKFVIILERNKSNLHHCIDPISMTISNPDPNNTVLVYFILRDFVIEFISNCSDKNLRNTIEPQFTDHQKSFSEWSSFERRS